ncbi:MAG: rRNA maturation RNase YbeY [Spirochaetaceae bacterium]|jgi:probable rRNA maturation factor|nr:rRNA maturation RNase YbeY [Spirochaetaceae bacterium]
MNRIEINAEEVPLPAWTPALVLYIERVLEALHKTNWDLSVLLCNDTRIRSLNNRYRGRDEATDVLSFSLGETLHEAEGDRYLPGDIVVSLDSLGENARYFGVKEHEELRRLVIHGILHLDGMDHATNDAGEAMLQLQEKLLNDLDDGALSSGFGEGAT